jgi:hypothetical protein
MPRYCPNCSGELKPPEAECWNCGAVFGTQSAWSPTDRPVGIFERRDRLIGRSNVEEVEQGRDLYLLAVVFITCCLSWWILLYADASAWVRTDQNAAMVAGGGTVVTVEEMLGRRWREFLSNPVPTIVFFSAFQLPTFAVLFLRNRRALRRVVLFWLALLVLFDLSALGAGGDYKGCSACDGPFLLHLAFGVILLPVYIICLVDRWLLKRHNNAL